MTHTNDRPTTRAAGILLTTREQPRRFLLMRHPDRWDLPKGHCDAGETDLQTALRETEEETGIPRQSISIDPTFHFQLTYPVSYKRSGNQVFQKTVVYFLGETEKAVTPTLTEHPSFRWFDWEPPHEIQSQTIDPLLAAVELHFKNRAQA